MLSALERSGGGGGGGGGAEGGGGGEALSGDSIALNTSLLGAGMVVRLVKILPLIGKSAAER